MNFDLVIRNGTLISASENLKADLGVKAGKIIAIADDLKGNHTVDASGLYVLPGAVDPHVHLQMPTTVTESSDNWNTGSIAAACGGTTTVIDFVEPEDDESLLDAFEKRRAQAESQTHIDFGLHMTLTTSAPQILKQVRDVVTAGMPSFKMYTTYDGFKLDDASFLKCFSAVEKAGGMALVHCENDALVHAATEDVICKGTREPKGHPEARPTIAEVEAIKRILAFAQFTNLPTYIVHISTAGGAKALLKSKKKLPKVYGETCPQYLLLSVAEFERPGFEGAKYVCSPQLREADHAEVLWRALRQGDLNTIGTDHCPFFFEDQKALGKEDFTKIPGGLPGIESRLALIHTFGVGAGHFSLNRWVELCCTAPAKIFGLYPQKGHLFPGADADIVLFDPQKNVSLSQSLLHEHVDYTPYDGFELTGYPVKTFFRGQLLAEDGQFVGETVSGQYLRRELAN